MSSSCGSDLPGSGFFAGEEFLFVVRIVTTAISLTVTSAWFSGQKIKRLSMFFAHWLSGLVAGMGVIVESAMVHLCWSASDVEGFIKTLKFIELSASNMYAVTNLAICVNLALVVVSHRTLSRIKSVSSPPLLLGSLAISVALAAPIIPMTEYILTTGTGFFVGTPNRRDTQVIHVCFFYVEFLVGICMFFIVTWLLLFWRKEAKECWKIHARVRFYFLQTLSGVAVNLGVGICGTINLVHMDDFMFILHSWSWSLRYIHFAVDTTVLYGALRERNMDERASGNNSGLRSSGSNVPSGQRVSCDGIATGTGRSKNTSKPISVAPMV
eukprot:g16379.t1